MPLTMNREVFITCAVTGAIHTPSMSKALPVTPQEIADFEKTSKDRQEILDKAIILAAEECIAHREKKHFFVRVGEFRNRGGRAPTGRPRRPSCRRWSGQVRVRPLVVGLGHPTTHRLSSPAEPARGSSADARMSP